MLDGVNFRLADAMVVPREISKHMVDVSRDDGRIGDNRFE
jgi:hypothetical protein